MDMDSEDGDGFDPLLNSIMDAMNSIKDATADKIYQKIRKEGNTNFSKPQVDRALARALNYGIFEIHNNRYRIRDVNLDDEDTVYQKKNNKNREQTPYRSGDYTRGDLNPERDNRRYRPMSDEENPICPSCGRRKKPKEKCDQKNKRKSVSRDRTGSKSPVSSAQNIGQSTCKEKNNDSNRRNINDGHKKVLKKRTPPKEQNRKRKIRSSSSETEQQKKLRKRSGSKKCVAPRRADSKTKKKTDRIKNDVKATKEKYFNQAKRNLKSTSTAYLRNRRPKNNKKKYSTRRRRYSKDEEKDEENPTTSSVRITKSKDGKSESDISEASGKSEDENKNKREEPSTSKNADEDKNKNKTGGKALKNLSKKESRVQESDWLGPPEPFHEGTVKQTNNSLTIQPMDSLPFRNPEDTSYFT